MDIELVRQQLVDLATLVEGWGDEPKVSAIERDLALDKIKCLYEELRFAECSPYEPMAQSEPQLPVVEQREDEDELEDDLSEIEVELTYYEGEEEEEEEEEETAEEEIEEEEVESEPIISIELEDISIIEEESKEIEEPEKPQEEPFTVQKAVVENSLFDLETIPVRTKSSRRSAILSLYSDGVVTPAPAPIPAPTQPSAPEVEESVEEQVEEVETPHIEPTPVSTPIIAPAQEPEEPEEVQPTIVEPLQEQEIKVDPLTIAPPAPTSIEIVDELIIEDDEEEEMDSEEMKRVTTLADTLSPHVETIAERYASQQENTTLSSEVTPMSSINDRYLIARDLFGGDMSMCEDLLATLEKIDNFDDAMIYIVENYEWDPEQEATKLVLKYLETKFPID